MIKPQLSTPGFPWRMAIAILLSASGGCALVACANLNLLSQTEAPTEIALSEATATENQVVPTETDLPLPTDTLTSEPPTETPLPPTITPTPEPVLVANSSANVRSGPGTIYHPVGGLAAGETAKVIG